MIVDAVFSPAPHTCRNCGSTVVDGNGKVIVVKNGKKEPKQSKRILPRVLMVDEFRSHASIEDKMSFICALKVILFNPDIQSRIMSDIKLLLY
nr:hypothetical protein [Enterococcus faecium]